MTTHKTLLTPFYTFSPPPPRIRVTSPPLRQVASYRLTPFSLHIRVTSPPLRQVASYRFTARAARNRLVQHNMRLVDFWVRRLIEHTKAAKVGTRRSILSAIRCDTLPRGSYTPHVRDATISRNLVFITPPPCIAGGVLLRVGGRGHPRAVVGRRLVRRPRRVHPLRPTLRPSRALQGNNHPFNI